eukprot:scpid104677/ scgid11736/ 
MSSSSTAVDAHSYLLYMYADPTNYVEIAWVRSVEDLLQLLLLVFHKFSYLLLFSCDLLEAYAESSTETSPGLSWYHPCFARLFYCHILFSLFFFQRFLFCSVFLT